jgi:hypothetical protein
MRALPLLLLAACATAHTPPPPPLPALPPEVKAVDVYGTVRFDADELRRELGPDFDRYLQPIDDEAENARLERALRDRLVALGFAWGKVSAIGYFKPHGMEWYVTLDVVEPEDAGRRLRFGRAPTTELGDVDGLVAAWNAYQSKGFELIRAKAITPQRPACKAFHCLHDFAHPELAPFAAKFDEVPAHKDALVRLLREAKDDELRAGAAFLLAHLTDGNEVVALLLPSLRDPSGRVRNNAMRVLQDIAHHHPEIRVPIEPGLEALDGPETTDRNKALALIDGLSARPEHHAAILAHGRTLVRLLRLAQPNNHDYAFQILKRVSAKDFGERDYAAWEKWLADPR